MAVWPHSIKPLADGYDNTPIENVRRTPSESGATRIRDLWGGVTKFKAEFEMRLSLANSRTIMAFYNANRASVVSFFDYDSSVQFTTETIGTGDGSALNFTIPACATAGQLVYVNGVLKTPVTDYNISVGTGALGQDRVIFVAGHAPPNGHAVTITYTGSHLYDVDIIRCEWHVVASTGRKQLSVRVEEAW